MKLINSGLRFKDIPVLTEEAIRLGYLQYNDAALVLSEAGKKVLEDEGDLLKNRNKDTWIKKEEVSIIPKISPDFIFLPNQHNLQL